MLEGFKARLDRLFSERAARPPIHAPSPRRCGTPWWKPGPPSRRCAMRCPRASAELAAERKQLADAERRGGLAAALPDPETATIAARFAVRHRERITLLERKLVVQRDEVALAEREVEEMTGQLSKRHGDGRLDPGGVARPRGGRRVAADRRRTPGPRGRSPPAGPGGGGAARIPEAQAGQERLKESPVAATAAPAPPSAGSSSGDTRFFGHPRGLATLFFTEMWERFSYYGMRALLILFMTAPLAAGGLGFDTAKAGADLRAVRELGLPALPARGLAGRPRARPAAGRLRRRRDHHGRAHLPGGAVDHLFYLGLVLIPLGTGLLKPNISALVGKLYAPDDVRRDAGYSLYYMGINTGAFIAPLITGWLAQSEGFRGILDVGGIRARERPGTGGSARRRWGCSAA